MSEASQVQTVWSESELSRLATRAFQGLGLTEMDAADVVKILVLADLFGLSTHGLSRIESYGERRMYGFHCIDLKC